MAKKRRFMPLVTLDWRAFVVLAVALGLVLAAAFFLIGD
jgi:hypothetical protein